MRQASKLAVRDHVSVSIHASVKDATVLVRLIFELESFNPRICKRCDSDFWKVATKENVSIHASVKDATKRQKSI